MLNTDRTLHSILHEHYDYIEGAFKRKGTKNDIIENWLKIEYTPISWPTIFVPEKAVRIGLNKAIYVYFNGDFDGRRFTVINKDKNKFNTKIENLELKEKESYIPRSKERKEYTKRKDFRTRNHFPSEKAYFEEYFELDKWDDNYYLYWKIPTNNIAKGTIAGTNLKFDPKYPDVYPIVNLLGKSYEYVWVLYTMLYGDIPAGYFPVNKDGDYHNLKKENIVLSFYKNKFYRNFIRSGLKDPKTLGVKE